jgi:hypothetical protein
MKESRAGNIVNSKGNDDKLIDRFARQAHTETGEEKRGRNWSKMKD